MKTREIEIYKGTQQFVSEYLDGLYDTETLAKKCAQWVDENPSVETMLKLFWFFDSHGLIRDDLCFDPQHFMETVGKEHFPKFDVEQYLKNR